MNTLNQYIIVSESTCKEVANQSNTEKVHIMHWLAKVLDSETNHLSHTLSRKAIREILLINSQQKLELIRHLANECLDSKVSA